MGIFTRTAEEGRAQPLTYRSHRPITAAAHRIDFNDKSDVERLRARAASGGSVQWQQEAWEYYDAVGEIKYALNLVGNVCSRVRLYAAAENDADAVPSAVDEAPNLDPTLVAVARRQMKRLASAHGGMAGLIRDYAINISVAGECYLVQRPAAIAVGRGEEWDVKSIDEVQIDASGRATIKRSAARSSSTGVLGGTVGEPLPEGAFIARIWRTHPRYTDDADSSMRGVLDLCAELLLLSRMVRGIARSRLNAGALYLPDGLSVAGNGEGVESLTDEPLVGPEGVLPVGAVEDDFEEVLVEAMTTPIEDEESAASVVPLIIRGPAELGDKIKQFKFERSFDETLAQRADRVLDRILQGLDVPKDVVTGLANVKYANAIRIDESLYKAHIEPLMLMLCDALTVTYLRPAMLAAGFTPEQVSQLVVWYDPSEITTRPDKAADADNGHARYLLSDEAWRRAHSFAETDAPDPDEIARRLMLERGMLGPEVTEALLERLVPGITDLVRAQSQADNPSPLSPGLQQVLEGGQPAPSPQEAPAAPPQREVTQPPRSNQLPTPTDRTPVPGDSQSAPVPPPAGRGIVS